MKKVKVKMIQKKLKQKKRRLIVINHVVSIVLLISIISCKLHENNSLNYNCKNRTIAKGRIQGLSNLKSLDSIPTCFFLECYDVNNSYELIWSPKLVDKENLVIQNSEISTDDLITDGKFNYLNVFNIYKLVHPIKDPISLEKYQDMNIEFPLFTKVYKLSAGEWKKVKILKLNDFEEYSLLRFNLYYNKKI